MHYMYSCERYFWKMLSIASLNTASIYSVCNQLTKIWFMQDFCLIAVNPFESVTAYILGVVFGRTEDIIRVNAAGTPGWYPIII